MRVYVSDMDPATGARRVRVTTEQQSQPGLVDALLAELRQLEQDVSDTSDPDGAHEVRRARRQQIIDRLAEFEQAPPPRLLHDRVTGAVDRFAWGDRSAAATALGAAILTLEIGEEAPDSLGAALRDDLLVRFSPTQRLELPASEVWRWINQHRELVERELFDQLPTSHPPEPPVSEQPGQLPSPQPVEPALDDAEEVGGATASALVAACEQAWTAIQTHHPDLPDAVMVLGTGVERGRLVKLGHWWGGRWVADGQTRGEVLLAGEALHLPPGEVFEILLHEAAHGLNAARGIKDTSRGGRYHNQRFKAAAEEVLLQVRALPPTDWPARCSPRTPPTGTTTRSSGWVTPCASPVVSTPPSEPASTRTTARPSTANSAAVAKTARSERAAKP